MPETSSKNFSAKALKGAKTTGRVASGAALKFGVPVGYQYVIYWFFTSVINMTLLHGKVDNWVAAIGVTAVAYMLKHFHRHLTKPSLLDALVDLAKFSQLMDAAQKAQGEPLSESRDERGPYM